jgi:hypothetical protein
MVTAGNFGGAAVALDASTRSRQSAKWSKNPLRAVRFTIALPSLRAMTRKASIANRKIRWRDATSGQFLTRLAVNVTLRSSPTFRPLPASQMIVSPGKTTFEKSV